MPKPVTKVGKFTTSGQSSNSSTTASGLNKSSLSVVSSSTPKSASSAASASRKATALQKSASKSTSSKTGVKVPAKNKEEKTGSVVNGSNVTTSVTALQQHKLTSSECNGRLAEACEFCQNNPGCHSVVIMQNSEASSIQVL